jgi:hypothetical protein
MGPRSGTGNAPTSVVRSEVGASYPTLKGEAKSSRSGWPCLPVVEHEVDPSVALVPFGRSVGGHQDDVLRASGQGGLGPHDRLQLNPGDAV